MKHLRAAFTDHPRSLGESYREHQAFAWRAAWALQRAAAFAFIHGILPCVCESSASSIVRALCERMAARASRRASPPAKAPR